MQIKHGLISCDSHGQVDKDAFTSRMSREKWGDLIPQVVELDNDKGQKIERWSMNGKVSGPGPFAGGIVNCPAAMGDPTRRTHPQRWEEVPKIVYDPGARLTALDADGVDAEVLFPNNPTQNFGFPGEADYELDCVRAYNDALCDYRRHSDRYVPLALIPYKSPINTIVTEITDAVKKGAGGVVMLTEPGITIPGVKPTADPFWEPLWSACEELGVPICWHGSGGLSKELAVPLWEGYSRHQTHTAMTARLCVTPSTMIPNLLFSGILERHPSLCWMLGETGMGWLTYVLESCDHEWERRQLWRDGFETRPSVVFNRQIFGDFWFEKAGIEVRDVIGIDNIMWESDYPHITTTYPESRAWVERVLAGVPEDEQEKMKWKNAARLFKLNVENGAHARS